MPRVEVRLQELHIGGSLLDRGCRHLRPRDVWPRRKHLDHRHAQPRQVQQELQQASGEVKSTLKSVL